jgi:hypothetical protein
MKRQYVHDPTTSLSTDDEVVLPASASGDLPSSKKEKQPKQIQSFVDGWLTDEKFKGWLIKKIGTDKRPQPFCKTCSKYVTCSKTGLKRHLDSASHKKCYASSTASSSTIVSLFNRPTIQDEARSMEIKLCAFIVEHNLPISISDHFVKLLRSFFSK